MTIQRLWRNFQQLVLCAVLLLASVVSLKAYNTDQPALWVMGQGDMTGNAANAGSSISTMTGENGPEQLWANSTRLFIADPLNNRIIGLPYPITANNETSSIHVGQQGYSESNPNFPALGPSSLYRPNSVWLNNAQAIIADTYNHRILIYLPVPAGTSLIPANYVIGQANMTSNSPNEGNSSPTSLSLCFPKGVFSDGLQMVAADSGNNRVLIYTSVPASSYAPANFVVGQTGMSGYLASAGQNGLNNPNSAVICGTKLVVADTGNNRVLIFNTVPIANNAGADVVVGQQDWAGNLSNRGNSSPGANTLNSPQFAYIFDSKLFVADTGNNRVLIFNQIPAAPDAAADLVLGQPDVSSYNANQGSSTASANSLSSPGALFCSASLLWVADSGNNRTLGYSDEVQFTPTLTSTSTGTPTATSTATSTITPTVTPTATLTATPAATCSSTALLSPSVTATRFFAALPSSTPTVMMTATPTLDLAPNTMLKRYYPNPVHHHAKMTIEYGWPQAGHGRIDIYDFLGKHVVTLLDAEVQSGGGQLIWETVNGSGKSAAPGVYFLTIRLDDRHESVKVVILP